MKGSIVKKAATYYCVYRVNGKQKWVKGGRTKKQAEKKLTEIVGEINDGTYREIKDIGFEEFTGLWLDTYGKTKLKPSTLDSYKMIIRVHLVPYLESMHLRDITTAMIQRYVANKLETQSPKSVVNHLVPLKEMLKHATRWGYLKHNPADYVEKPRVEREEMEFFTPEEIRAFLQEVRPKRYVFFLTAVLSGCRRGELLGLQVGDLDFRKNQIHVRRSLWKGGFVTPKSKYSVRSIDMSPYLAHELKKHLLSKPHSDMDLLFCNDEGKPLDPDSLIKRHFLPALRRAKLRMIPFHSLRHSNVALRIEEGHNSKYIQRQLGHASIQTTLDRYGHLISETNQEGAKGLDSRLGFEVHKKVLLEKC